MSAWMREIRNDADTYRIGRCGHYDRNRPGALGGKRCRRAARHDDVGFCTNEIGGERREACKLAVARTVVDDHVPSFDVACFTHPFEEGIEIRAAGISRSAFEHA